MKISYKNVYIKHIDSHIKTIFIDNKIDLVVMKFLIYQATSLNYKGIYNTPSTNFKYSEHLGSLFKALGKLNLNWKNASEKDIKIIRDSMMGWKKNENLDNNFFYNIKDNDSMNRKLQIWYEFYQFLEKFEIKSSMYLTKIRKKKKTQYYNDHLLSHTFNSSNSYYYDWQLKIKSSPKRNSYHALNRIEYYHFSKELYKKDIIYGIFADFLVNTGLRINAGLQVNYEIFENLFQTLKSKSLDDYIEIPYISKGNINKLFHLPIRTIIDVKNDYLSRLYIKRKKLFKKKYPNLKQIPLWLKKDGTPLNEYFIRKNFKIASKEIGYLQKYITPHWLRHTFATWTIIDFCEKEKIALSNTGIIPHPMITLILQEKLGHTNRQSVLKYIVTALKLMKVKSNNGPIKISYRTFKNDYNLHKILEIEAKIEFSNDFKLKRFDPFKYASAKNIVIKDDY